MSVLTAGSLAMAEEAIKAATEEGRRIGADRLADHIERHAASTLEYFAYPQTHWRRLRTCRAAQRPMDDVSARLQPLTPFPTVAAAIEMATARFYSLLGHGGGRRMKIR